MARAEEAVRVEVDQEVTLEGGLTMPRGQTRGGALILHPHPQYGGSMHNNVVEALVEAAVSCGRAALRINFRGVGASTGRHGGGEAEQADVKAAARWLGERVSGPILLMGYSFGSLVGSHAAAGIANLAGGVWVAPPLVLGPLADWPQNAGSLLMVAGDRDEYTQLSGLQAYDQETGARSQLITFKGVDHFWWGRESELIQSVTNFIAESCIKK